MLLEIAVRTFSNLRVETNHTCSVDCVSPTCCCQGYLSVKYVGKTKLLLLHVMG